MPDGQPSRGGTQFGELLAREAPEALIALSLDGRILFWNKAAEETFGYCAEEAIGKALDELIVPPEYVEEAQHTLAQTARGGSARLEGVRRRKDGSLLDVQISMRHAALSGAESFVACIVSDVSHLHHLMTERKRLEQQMHDANRSKSDFLANISHDLRTPLNVIIGFADLMYTGRVGPVSAEHHEYLGDILTSAKHLLQLVNDVLDLAKVESGKWRLDRRGSISSG
jgi:PAS domain S-box-containing protein